MIPAPPPAAAAPHLAPAGAVLITDLQVAEFLQCSRRMVWRMAARGNFPKPIHLGRLARWDPEALNEWIRDNRKQ